MPGAVKESKNAKRRAAKKAKKEVCILHPAVSTIDTDTYQAAAQTPATESQPEPAQSDADTTEETPAKANGVQSNGTNFDDGAFLSLDESNPLFEQFKDVMDRFQQAEEEATQKADADKPQVFYDDDDDIPDEEEEAQQKVSKKKRKELNKLSTAELKALVKKPDLVEWTDTSAPDPRLLVAIKGHRNVVPVPAHWALKREYLSSKRGIEKPPFALPKFIQETGIAEMRDAVLEKQNEASLKQRQRERVAPKMGKLDIDYQRLYEAFFRFQTKPELTRYGEVYYEGKEFETNLRHLRPGELSDDLKEALNIPPGAPPPWLINQQRWGPPPSYPALKVPGLNAPPPPGAQWGFHPGGYGKPPVDEYNKPLFGGDIFGVIQPQQAQPEGEPVEKSLWGELEIQEDESEEEDEDEEEAEEEDADEDMGAGLQTPSGLDTPGGMASTVPTEFGGTESVGGIELRKQKRGTETEESTAPRAAYQVLQEKNIRSQGFFGGERAYDIRGAQDNANLPVLGQEDNRRKRKAGDVDVSVDVDNLIQNEKLNKDEIKRQFDAGRQEQNPWGAMNVNSEDLSQMIADESRKRIKKDDERRSRR